MKCQNCNCEIPANQTKCPNCGNEIITDQSTQFNYTYNQKNMELNTESKPKSKKRKVITISAIAAIIVVIIISIVVTMSSNVKYISDRSVDFEESSNQFRVFFSLLNSNEKYVSSDGTAHIKITNDNSEIVFEKDIEFNKEDFSTWSNQLTQTSYESACIYIPKDNISEGTIDSGVLTLGVKLNNGTEFENETFEIYGNLPVKSVTLNLPNLPETVNEYGYENEHEKTIEIDEIKYETDYSYGGETSIKISFNITLLENKNEYSDYSNFTFKIKDSTGKVIENREVFCGQMSIGDTKIQEEIVYNLKPGETYTLELNDSKL